MSSTTANANASANGPVTTTIAPRIAARILSRLESNRITIIIGPTGSGKSTQIPPLLLQKLKDHHDYSSSSTKGGGNGLQRPILCTQPRRLAVVAIATRVSQQSFPNEPLGTTVGYQIGNQNLSHSRNTKLLFTTSGILLEELRASTGSGLAALNRFRVIIIDECHERSPESDLVLVMIRHILQTTPPKQIQFKLILMSATFHHQKYKRYFQSALTNDQEQQHIDTITIETADSFDAFHRNVETFYLEDAVQTVSHKKQEDGVDDDDYDDQQLMPHSTLTYRRFISDMKRDPNKDLSHMEGRSLSPVLISLIRDLINTLDENFTTTTPQNTGPFLVFAPTYRHLEQLHQILMEEHYYQMFVLHSSVDIEECLRAMESSSSAPHTNRRRIFLASAIADSSVTVPGVSCVIDTCRALEVRWDYTTRTQSVRTVWASQSICDQRRGRTGRTCPGQVYRLVPKGIYHSATSDTNAIGASLRPRRKQPEYLPQWDVPQLTLSSCQNEIMTIVSSAGGSDTKQQHQRRQKDPRQLLSECLDPPEEETVDDAIAFLKEIGACQEINNKNDISTTHSKRKQKGSTSTQKGTTSIIPTSYGQLLAALPMTILESRLVIAGGTIGLFPEALALEAILSNKPSPIEHSFADTERNRTILQTYYWPASDLNNVHTTTIAQFSAYMFWDAEWYQQKRRWKADSEFANKTMNNIAGDGHPGDTWDWTPQIEEEHAEWCRKHQINPTSVRAITTVIENTYQVLFQANFEPSWLRTSDVNPIWKRKSDWAGPQMPGERDMLLRVYGDRVDNMSEAFIALCKSRGDVHVVLEKMTGPGGNIHTGGDTTTPDSASPPSSEYKEEEDDARPLACVHFLMGNCMYGDNCRNSHSAYARRPPCRYFLEGTCTRGLKCVYEHKLPQKKKEKARTGTNDPMSSKVPIRNEFTVGGNGNIKEWYRACAPYLMMLGEGDFSFSRYLKQISISPLICSTNEGSSDRHGQNSSSTTPPISIDKNTELTLVDATRLHTDQRVLWCVEEFGLCVFSWNFPFSGSEEDPVANERMLLETFQSVSCLWTMKQQQQQQEQQQGGLKNENIGDCGVFRLALTLQGDQFSRWNVMGAAWRVGWKLECWSPFDHRGEFGDYYKPRRANGETFLAENPRMYVFSK